jgi:hypothetical protein
MRSKFGASALLSRLSGLTGPYLEEHGEKLGRVITADIAGRADALTDARARQLALRAEVGWWKLTL